MPKASTPKKASSQLLDHQVLRIKAPNKRWVYALFGNDLKGNFICKPIRKKQNTKVPVPIKSEEGATPTSITNNDFGVSGLDVTGSPLEPSFGNIVLENSVNEPEEFCLFQDWENFEAGFSVEQARSLLNQRVHPQDSGESNWCLCDTKDSNQTWLLGMGNKDDRYVWRHLVTKSDPVPYSEVNKLREIIERHSTYSGKVKTTSTVSAIYCPVKTDMESNIEVECEWTRCREVLQSPPLDATTTVHLKVDCGWKSSILLPIYKELQLLTNLSEALKSKKITWEEYPENINVAEALENLLQDLRQSRQKFGKNRREVNESDEGLSGALLKKFVSYPENVDVTDMLWDVLKYCSSYEQLVECLEEVFAALERRQIKPQVSRSNKCQMATLFVSILKGEIGAPVLQGSLPFRLLVGMGIQKFKNLYFHMYAELELAGIDHIRALGGDVEGLWVLHQALECAALCNVHLGLPASFIGTHIRRLLKQLQPAVPTQPLTTSFTIQTQLLKDNFEKYCADIWCVRLESISAKAEIKSAYLLSVSPLDKCFTLLSDIVPSSVTEKEEATSSDVASYFTATKLSLIDYI